MRIIYFLLGLSFLIFFHELGHFIFAKLFKVYVYEFSLFMGPKLLQKKIGETKYSIRLLPIGGYVSMAGENDTQSDRNEKEELETIDAVASLREDTDALPVVDIKDKKKEEEQLPDVPFERTLPGIANWKKLIIMFAGPMFNIILCFILLIAYFLSVPTSKVNVTDSSALYTTGLRSDDEIKEMYVYFYEGDSYTQTKTANKLAAGAYLTDIEYYKSLESVYNGAFEYLYEKVTNVYPDFVNAPTSVKEEIKFITVDSKEYIYKTTYNITYLEDKSAIDSTSYPTLETLGMTASGDKLSFNKSISSSAKLEVKMAGAIYNALGSLFSKNGLDNVAGPVGMYSIATSFMDEGFMYYLYFIAMISVNLGIMNLLPFPALDGGKIVITIIEMIRRKRVNPKVEGILNAVGFALLMGFMAFITFKDIFFPSI